MAPIKPVTVSVDVPQGIEEVFAYLDVLANHEAFTDHLLKDWKLSGPASGVGSKARMHVNAPGSNEVAELEVLESEPPHRTVEETFSAKGKRRTRGTYTLTEAPGGGTHVEFELAWVEAPRSERLGTPLTRAFIKRANGRAMKRLKDALAQQSSAASADQLL
jgi:uncharacterized protein YndB with AHSA1/START domain